MKTRKKLFVAVLVILATWACKKDAKFGTSISPVSNIIGSAGEVLYFRDEPILTGTVFKSNVEGRITHLGLRAGRGTYTVALWDSSAQNILISSSVNITDSLVFTYKDITDVNIIANKTYIVTMFNQIAEGGSGANAYKIFSTNLPLQQSNITILSSIYDITSNSTQLFPILTTHYDRIFGIADIKFEPKL